jgi:hypothetical protein
MMRRLIRSGLVVLALVSVSGCESTPEYVNAFPLALVPGHAQSVTGRVQQALSENPELSAFQFHVETQRDTVFLSGYVKTIRQSDLAGEVAQKVPGVKSVENNVIVRK